MYALLIGCALFELSRSSFATAWAQKMLGPETCLKGRHLISSKATALSPAVASLPCLRPEAGIIKQVGTLTGQPLSQPSAVRHLRLSAFHRAYSSRALQILAFKIWHPDASCNWLVCVIRQALLHVSGLLPEVKAPL